MFPSGIKEINLITKMLLMRTEQPTKCSATLHSLREGFAPQNHLSTSVIDY